MGLHLQRPLNLLYYGGNVEIMHTRLSSLADNIVFDHDRSIVPGLSVPLIRNIFETGAGPLKKMVETLSFKPSKLNALRSDIDISISQYFEDNYLRMDHLMTKAQKIKRPSQPVLDWVRQQFWRHFSNGLMVRHPALWKPFWQDQRRKPKKRQPPQVAICKHKCCAYCRLADDNIRNHPPEANACINTYTSIPYCLWLMATKRLIPYFQNRCFRKIAAQLLISSLGQILYVLETHIGVFMEIFIHQSARRIGGQNVLCKVDALMNWSLVLPLLKTV